jgi:hypothetical protein
VGYLNAPTVAEVSDGHALTTCSHTGRTGWWKADAEVVHRRIFRNNPYLSA